MYTEIQLFTQWMRCKHSHTSTAVHYGSDITLFFIWAVKPPIEITVSDIDAYLAHCRERGHATATLNRRLAALRKFYNFLNTYTDDPPANPVIPRRHFIKKSQRLPRDVADVSLKRLFAIITSPRDKAIFTLMARCGLRVGEVHRLSLPDLELTPAQEQLPRLRIWGKGGKQRIAYLSPQAVEALEEWLAVRPDDSSQAVFLNHAGHRLSIAGIQQRLAGYCHHAGVQVTCHQLRHSFGRHLTEAQVPITTIQRLLGHAQLQTTQIYAHLSNTQAQTEYEAAIAKISDWLQPDQSVGSNTGGAS